jgi:hypothetical protein
MPIEGIYSDLELEDLFKFKSNSIIMEGIFLASRDLYNELIKINTVEEFQNNKKVLNSFFKYLTRLSSRCTPFGLFSGCSVGYLGNENSLLRDTQALVRTTSIDNSLLNKLILKYLEFYKYEIDYIPNNTIYEVGNQLRYIESISDGTVSKHVLSAVESEEMLKVLMDFSREGRTLDQVVNFIINLDYGFEREEVIEFIDSLIDNQFLVPSLSTVVVGKLNTLEVFINKVKNLEFKDFLLTVKTGLKNIDDNLQKESKINLYNDLESLIINKLDSNTKSKNVFQSDLTFKLKKRSIPYNYYKTNLLTAFSILNRLSRNYTSSNLKKFQKEFLNRYENRVMPLSLVLDTELGIDYSSGDYCISGFVDDLKKYINYNKTSYVDKNLTREEVFILNKILLNNDNRLELKLEELNEFDENWSDVPDTISCMISFYEDFISLSNVGGSSASNLIGRFGYLDKDFSDLIDEVFEFESIDKGKIVAEIVHLPESRTGNILYRSNTREYEIPYLGNSSKLHSKQIPVSDILVYIENDLIKLKSKSLEKEIVPKLSNAHNYSLPTSVPIYQFLCDMQTQNKRASLDINITTILDLLKHIPRISYKDIILVEEQWILTQAEISSIKDKESFNKILVNRQINSNFYLVEGDNTLLIRKDNNLSIDIFIDIIKRKKSVILKESLHDFSQSIVKNDELNSYSNEVIIAFHKE